MPELWSLCLEWISPSHILDMPSNAQRHYGTYYTIQLVNQVSCAADSKDNSQYVVTMKLHKSQIYASVWLKKCHDVNLEK